MRHVPCVRVVVVVSAPVSSRFRHVGNFVCAVTFHAMGMGCACERAGSEMYGALWRSFCRPRLESALESWSVDALVARTL